VGSARLATSRRLGLPVRRPWLSISIVLLCVGTLVCLFLIGHGPLVSFAYGAVAISYLIFKLMGSVLYRPVDLQVAGDPPAVAVVVPCYNEDPEAFTACLTSLLLQSTPFDEIYVVDDGSSSSECVEIARTLLAGAEQRIALVHVFERNQGKRYALAWGFERTEADLVMMVDSDTMLNPNCLEEALKPLADPQVFGVTGTIRATNVATNLLTRLIDLRYANAFLYERAAYSKFGGNVLCCCGSMSVWRTAMVRETLADFVNQTFLGVHVAYGDDRRLTNYALQRGKVVIQTSAVAHTLVPERLGHFLRQQVRWNKSFFRESLWLLRTFRPNRIAWFLSLAEMVTWIGFTTALVFSLLVRPILGSGVGPFYLAMLVITSYARSARYLGAPGGRKWSQEWSIFALAPIYGLMHYLLLMPLRFYSIATLKQGAWGTRTTVEVVAPYEMDVVSSPQVIDLRATADRAPAAMVSRGTEPRSTVEIVHRGLFSWPRRNVGQLLQRWLW